MDMVKTAEVTPKYTGIIQKPFLKGVLRSRTAYLVMRKMMAAKHPEMPGAMAQAAKTELTPSQDQSTWLGPMVAKPTPMMPPTIEWVVETGRPIYQTSTL